MNGTCSSWMHIIDMTLHIWCRSSQTIGLDVCYFVNMWNWHLISSGIHTFERWYLRNARKMKFPFVFCIYKIAFHEKYRIAYEIETRKRCNHLTSSLIACAMVIDFAVILHVDWLKRTGFMLFFITWGACMCARAKSKLSQAFATLIIIKWI